MSQGSSVTPRPQKPPAVRDGHITCVGVRKVFFDIQRGQEIVALDDLNLDIKPGTFLAILGPSGCGKTTLLNILAGFERRSAGDVLIDGDVIRGPGPDRGVVFQDYALFPWLTVAKNVAYGLVERGRSRRDAVREAERWLGQVGLQGFGEKYPHELSGGMRQRVALIRVLANDSKILLMDEPFAALDALTRETLQRELAALWQRTGKTIVFITHNVDEAIYLGDRVAIMSARPGRIKSMIDVDLARPRDITSDQFNERRRLATQELQTELVHPEWTW